MGGFGSGRWAYHRKKATVEASYSVNISQFTAAIPLIVHGITSQLEWRSPVPGPFVRELHILLTRKVWGLYMHLTIRGERVEDIIPLQKSVPYYGGARWWFTCPRCGERARKLYWPAGRPSFGCRVCWHLTYRSQRMDRLDRERERIRRIKSDLGAHGRETAPGVPPPPRPKGMKERQYRQLLIKLRASESRYWQEMHRRLQRFSLGGGMGV